MTIYSLLIDIIGTPIDDMQTLFLYMSACTITTILFFSVVYVFKVISQIFKRD